MEWITTTTILHDLRDYSNQSAWERLAARFRRPIVRFAREMGLSASDADDVAQETLLAFAEAFRRDGYDPQRGRLSKWLFGIAFRQALAARRKRNRAEHDGESALQHVSDENSATLAWDREWEQAMLGECLERVRGEFESATYAAFALTVIEGAEAADAARQLNVPLKSVYNAKHRVLKRIRELRAELEDIA